MRIFKEVKTLDINIRIRLILSFITKLHTTSTIVLLPIFFSQLTSKFNTSIIISIILISNIIGKFSAGITGDKYNKKKLLLGFNSLEVLFYSCLIISLFFNFKNLIWLGALFTLNNFFSSSKGPLLESLLLDSLQTNNKKFVFSLNYWLSNVSMSFSFVIAGFIFKGNLKYVLCFGLICHLITIFLINTYIKDSNKEANTRKPKGYIFVLKDYNFVLFSVGFLFLLGVEMQLSNFMAVYFNENFHARFYSFDINGIKLLSILQMVNTILVIILPIAISKIFINNSNYSFLIGICLYSFGYAALLLTDNLYTLIILVFMYTLGELLYYPERQAHLASIVPKEHQTKYMAFNQIIIQSSRFLGALGIYFFSKLNIISVSLIIFLMGALGGSIIYLTSKKNILKRQDNNHINNNKVS